MNEQSKDPLKEQLLKLMSLGNKAGLYDAVQFIEGFLKKREVIEKKKGRKINKDVRRVSVG